MRIAILMLVACGAAAQTTAVPEAKMTFEVASVKPTKTFTSPSFPMSPESAYVPGGRLIATFNTFTYILFAYKLWLTQAQRRDALASVPKWVGTDLYEIRAKGAETATKDEMRWMMQALLAERFGLRVHFEMREEPVFEMTLEKPGKLGPKLRPHAEGPACGQQPLAAPGPVFPGRCGVTAAMTSPNGQWRMGSRDTTMEGLAGIVQGNDEVREPVVDRTGLSGTFDYTLEYAGQAPPAPGDPNAAAAPENSGPTFREALREQLGLKLVGSRAAVRTMVIDHIERPSEN